MQLPIWHFVLTEDIGRRGRWHALPFGRHIERAAATLAAESSGGDGE